MVIEVFLEIDDFLSCIPEDIKKVISIEISEGLNNILEVLGIPGTSTVNIAKLVKEKVLSHRFMRITINEVQCRYPDLLLVKVQNYVNGCYNNPDSFELGLDLNDTYIWLKNVLDDQDKEKNNIRNIIKFFSISCLEIVKLQPQILLGSSQIKEYLSTIQISTEQRNDFYKILSTVISHRISISNKEKVQKVIERGFAEDQSNEDIVEELFEALHPNIIQILLPIEYFRSIKVLEQYNQKPEVVFKLTPKILSDKLGFICPDFQFVVNNDLNPNCFTFRINHLTTVPQIGLKREELLVNETSKRLTLLKINSVPILNPANLTESSIIQAEHKQLVEEAGLTTINQLEYIFLCLSSIIREFGSFFIYLDYIDNVLEETSELSLKGGISLKSLTRLLRTLVSEEISILKLNDIFESITNFFNNSRKKNTIILIEFVRSNLNIQISHKFSQYKDKLIAYLIDSGIETKLLNYKSLKLKSPFDHPSYKKILSLIKDELGSITEIRNPVILTKVKIRSILREIIAPECPRVTVLSYNELAEDITVQPIGRLSLG